MNTNLSPKATSLVESFFSSLGPRAKQIAQIYLENPRLSRLDISKRVGVSHTRVYTIFKNNRFLNAINEVTRQNFKGLSPLAGNSVRECASEIKNTDVKLKASLRILEENKIIGPSSVNVHHSGYESLSVDDLKKIVEDSTPIQSPIIDGEIVGNEPIS